VPQSDSEPAADPEVLAYNYEHFGPAHITLDRLGGPEVGDAAPDFSATTLAGTPFSLSDLRGRAVVLETGSATCPMYVKGIDAMNAVAGRFPEVAFLVLYTREAHPGEHVGPHRSGADKTRGARLIAEEDGERRTIVIDDLRGNAHQRYGAMFNTVHIIDAAGTIVFRALWNDPEAVEDVLRRLSEGRSPDDVRSAGIRPSPAAHKRVLNRAGPQAVRDFAAARPLLHHARAASGRHRTPVGGGRHEAPSYPYPGSGTPRRPEDLYASPPPWDIGRPQPAFLALAEAGAIRGRVLDVGCGTGEHVLMSAGLGLDATGVDLSSRALAAAKDKAHGRGRTARFLLHDARQLADLGEPFDTVLDCGLFHILSDGDRAAFVDSLHSVLQPGGRYFMLGFSDQQPSEWGRVRKLTQDEIRAAFADGWRIDSIEPSTIDITTDPDGIRAWLAALTRT
jgi:SAM-dependent methyltransferase